MKKILIHILIYGISLVISLYFGGIHIAEESITPLLLIPATIFMALVWRGRDTPNTMNIPESSDVILTYEEKRTMLFASSETLYASIPLQLPLIFTWPPLPKILFSLLVFVFAIGIGFHLGRRKIRAAVYARMNPQDKEE